MLDQASYWADWKLDISIHNLVLLKALVWKKAPHTCKHKQTHHRTTTVDVMQRERTIQSSCSTCPPALTTSRTTKYVITCKWPAHSNYGWNVSKHKKQTQRWKLFLSLTSFSHSNERNWLTRQRQSLVKFFTLMTEQPASLVLGWRDEGDENETKRLY